MKLLRPRSLSALVLLGLTIIVLPLIGMLVAAGLQMRQTSEASQLIVADGVALTRLTQQLFAQSALLERRVQFYPLLRDDQPDKGAGLLEAYGKQDAQLAENERRLATRLRLSEARSALQDFTSLREGISRQMQAASQQAPEFFEGLLTDFTRLQAVAGTVSERVNAQIDAETDALRKRSLRVQQLMFWGFLVLLPLTAGAILLFSLRAVRPLRQVDRAISELGSGALHSPIRVRGPADIEKLGAQLEWLRLRLLELAEERNRFLRHMSHELKTPLANIREGTELLMDGAVGELGTGQREVTGILRENGLRLQRMIENLLSFSAWQTSSVGLELTEFRLRLW